MIKNLFHKNTQIDTESAITQTGTNKWLSLGKVFGKVKGHKPEEIFVYLLIFLTPIFFLPLTLFPVVLTRQVVVGLILLGLFVYLLARFIASGQISLPPRKILFVFAIWLGAVTVSSVFSQIKNVSFLGNTYDSLFWVGMYALGFLVLVSVLRRTKAIRSAWTAYIVGAGTLAIITLFQLSGVFIFPFSFTKNASFNPVGSVFASGIFLAAFFAGLLSFLTNSKVGKKKIKYALWALVVLIGFLILQINLWVIWLALAVSFIAVSFILGYGVIKRKEISLSPLLVPFAVVTISIIAILLTPKIPSLLSTPAELSPSFEGTVNIIKDAFSFKTVLQGTGPGTFSSVYSLHRPESINATNFWGVQFHQGYAVFLTNFVTWGLLGLVAFALVLIVLYKTFLSGVIKNVSYKEEQAGSNDTDVLRGILMGSLSSSLVLLAANFVYRGNVVLELFMFFVLAIGFSVLVKTKTVIKEEFNLHTTPKLMLFSSLGVIVFISIAVAGVYLIGQNYIASTYAGMAVNAYREDANLGGALQKLDRALKVNNKDTSILRVSAQALVLRAGEIVRNTEMTKEQKVQNLGLVLQNAVAVAKSATEANPNDVQNWIQLAQVYGSAIGIVDGAENLAVETYDKARERDPLNPSLPLAQARAHLELANILQTRIASGTVQDQQILVNQRATSVNFAIEKLNESLKLKENYSTARIYLASAYRNLGNLDGAISEMTRVVNLNSNNANFVFQLGLYQYERNDFRAASVSFARAVNLADGVFGNARYFWGISQYNLGDREAGIKNLEKIVLDNPESSLAYRVLTNMRQGRPALADLSNDTAAPVPDTGGVEEPVLQ